MSITDESSPLPSPSSTSPRGMDPLLKDLSERKQSFRRNVASLAIAKQDAETKAKRMEEEICRLLENLEDRNRQLEASASTAEKYLKELDDLRSQLSAAQARANARTASAQAGKLLCLKLLKEVDEKNNLLKELEDHVSCLEELLDVLQKDLQARGRSQRQLSDEAEHDITQTVARSRATSFLDEFLPNKFEKIGRILSFMDEAKAGVRERARKCFWANLLWRLACFFLALLQLILRSTLFKLPPFCLFLAWHDHIKRRREEEEEEEIKQVIT